MSLSTPKAIEEEILRVPHVIAAAPFIETLSMYNSFRRFSFFLVKGIDPLKEAAVGDLKRQLLRPEELREILPPGETPLPDRRVLDRRVTEVLGTDRTPLKDVEIEDLFSLQWRRKVRDTSDPLGRELRAGRTGISDDVPPGILVGINLLLDRDVFLGDEIQLITLSPLTGQPILGSFIVTGAFKSGQFEADSSTALVRIERIAHFLDLFDPEAQDDRIDGIRIALDDYRNASQVRRDIVFALARRTVGAKLPRLLAVIEKTATGFGDGKVEGLVGEFLSPLLQAGRLVPEDDVRSALKEAAGLLADPALQESIGRRLQEALVGRGFVLETQFSEAFLLEDLTREAKSLWVEALLGGLRSPGRPASGEALKHGARMLVLETAERDLAPLLGELKKRSLAVIIRTWEEQRSVMIQAVDQEKWIVGFLVFLLNFFIGCVVLLMLILIVIEKTQDIGVLLALGAQPRGVVWIFLAGGLVIVTVGVLLGLLVGWAFVENINRIHDAIFAATGIKLFEPEIYQMDRIPTTVTISEVLVSIFPSVLFGFLASLVPAIWASHQDPIKAIHYE